MRLRVAIGALGVLLGLFGVFRLITQVPSSDLFVLVIWFAGALVIHDGVLSPIVVGAGVALERVPPRARRFLQAALVAVALISAIVLPMIHRENSQPASKALLLRNYSGSLVLVLGVITAVALVGYLVSLVLDRRGTALHGRRRPGPGQRSSTANSRPPEDQSSPTR